MKPKVELYSGTYKIFAEELYQEIRKETYGKDIGQTSWLTADECRKIFSILKLTPDKKVLEIGSGSGGPAVFLVKETGCHLTGIDINENGINNAHTLKTEAGLENKITFLQADASEPLPFSDESFDVVISLDSINHFKNRGKVLKEFYRVLKKEGQLLYTDPIIVTGILTNEEIAIRSSIGFFLFVPVGENERYLGEAGFKDIQVSDVTENMASVSIKWKNAREKRKEQLLKIEEENQFLGLQSFLDMVHFLSSQKRLSRFMLVAFK
jgi:ubiquinone/menaquinone biosynthesis C-methylase UbiE